MAIQVLANKFVFVPRADWGAKYSAGRSPMPKQVNTVVFHHTVTALKGSKAYDGKLDVWSDDPCADMRLVERVLHERGLAPGYSYVIHPSGVILEGAGGMKGAHTEGWNSKAYGISFLGNFDKHPPTPAMFESAAFIVNLLRLGGRLPGDLSKVDLKMHRQTKATACPGAHLASIPTPDGKRAPITDVVRAYAYAMEKGAI